MSQEETSVEETASPEESGDAGENSATVAEAAESAPEVEPEGAEGEAEAADEQGPADSAASYKAALDSYLAGDLRRALEVVDAVLERDPETELRPRLERLRRRAEDRIAKEPPEEEPEAAGDEEGETAEPEDEGEAAEDEEDAETEDGDSEAEEDAEAEEGDSEESAAVAQADDSSEASALAASTDQDDEPSEGAAPAGQRIEKTASGRLPEGEAPTTTTESGRVVSPSGRAPAQGARRPPSAAGTSGAQRRVQRRPGQGGVVQRRSGGTHKALQPSASAPQIKADLDRMNNSVNRMANSLRVVEGSVVKVAEAYQRIAKSHKRKDQAYDQLYEELRNYKENFLLAAQKPLFKDVILLFDGVRRTLSGLEGEGDKISKAKVLEGLKHIQDEVLEVLYRRDIELIEEHPEKLNIDFQKPVQRIETDNPEEDRQVVQVVREGFRMNGNLLRAQEVIVKRCVKERETE